MADSDLLTVPQPLAEYELYLPIANEYVALPAVRTNGWIDSEILRAIPLDGGLACETFDPETRLPMTGRHFATCAGFLGYAIQEWLKEQ